MSNTENVINFSIENYLFNIQFTQWCCYTNSEILFEVTNDGKKISFLCSLVINESNFEDDFLSLNINYKEPSYFAGRISNGKRDRYSEREILISRSIDKTIRPLLKGLEKKALSFNLMILNYADNIDLVSCAQIAALFCFKKIYNFEAGAIKIALNSKEKSKKHEIKLFPNLLESLNSECNITITANKNEIFSLDVESNNFSPTQLNLYIKEAVKYCEIILNSLKKVKSNEKMPEYLIQKTSLINLKKEIKTLNMDNLIKKTKLSYEEIRFNISSQLASENLRIDDRKLDEIRKINIDLLSNEKGNNVIFQRGKTTVLGAVQFCNDTFNIGETVREEKNLISNYNFPGFCTGNVFEKKSNRREVGHSDLIRSAFQKIIHKDINMRLYADVLSSDGSSSMASVSAISCTGLKNGIMENIVTGISVGCFRNLKEETFIADMNAIEDQFSEIDFKIAGTNQGITAIKMDSKSYLSVKNLPKVLKLGKESVDFILEKINEFGIKPTHKTVSIEIDPRKIGILIGPSGKHIKDISFKTKCRIKTNQNGLVFITGEDLALAMAIINSFTLEQSKNTLCGFIVRNNMKNKTINTLLGDIILDKEIECKPKDIIKVKVVDWALKKFKFVELISF